MFTYNLSSTNADNALVAQVRLELGDTEEGAGVKVDGGNFSDEEILYKLNQLDRSVMLAVRALCGILARQWAIAADVQVGPRKESYRDTSKRWQELAESITDGSADLLSAHLPCVPFEARCVRVWPFGEEC